MRPTLAHDSWLSLPTELAGAGAEIALQLSTGDHFPSLGHGTAVARVARAELVFGEQSEALRIGLPGDRALPLQGRWNKASAALAVVSLHPRDLELDADAVAIYLGELGNDPLVAERQARQPRWRERFRKHAKAIIRRAPGAPLAAASVPQGLAFELVPDGDPSGLADGDPLRVCAYAHGLAVGPVYLGLVEASGLASWRWTDPSGCAVVQPATSGYLLRSIRLRPSRLPALEWESEFASLTVYRLDAENR